MVDQDLTSTEETLKETAEKKETSPEETLKQTAESEVEQKEKRYKAQQAENIRLKKQTDTLQEQIEKLKDVKPPAQVADIDGLIDKKVQARMAPLEAQASKDAVDNFLKSNPGANDYLDKISELLPSSPGKNVTEKLENSYLIASKDAAKQAGRMEMAFTLHQQGQVVASGGSASSSRTEGSLPSLSAEEREVAQKMGLTEEAYATNKWREPRPAKRGGQ